MCNCFIGLLQGNRLRIRLEQNSPGLESFPTTSKLLRIGKSIITRGRNKTNAKDQEERKCEILEVEIEYIPKY